MKQHLAQLREQLHEQDRQWQRVIVELAALPDVRFFIPEERLEEIETALDVRPPVATYVLGSRV